MKRIFLFVIVGLIFLLISKNLEADCPHCYMLANVKLIMKDGSVRIGYSPLFYGSVDHNIVKERINLKKIFRPDIKSIEFAEKYYLFKGIGYIFAKEEVKTINVDQIEQLIFLKWIREVQGASALDTIPKETVHKLHKNKILNVTTLTANCSDTVYININPNLSAEEFDFLFKHEPYGWRRDEFNEFYEFIMNKLDWGKGIDGVSIPMDTLISIIREKIDIVNEQVSILPTKSFENKWINEYLLYFRKIYEKRLRFYDAIISYIKYYDTKKLKEFVDTQIEDKNIKRQMYESIKNKDTSIQLKKIIQPLRVEMSFYSAHRMFKKAVEENGIIEFTQTWD